MATRTIGVDIGSFAVRAAEVAVQGDTVTLVRFGQVTLPPDAVRDGEVVDVHAVSAALRRLWSEAGFKAKKVVVGVANQRAIVRQAEVAQMTEDDLRAALQFEAQELIPIPVAEAILDFRILDSFKDAEGADRMHIVLAAAQTEMVRSHIAAVEGAGLTAIAVDAVPFALVRALATRTSASVESDADSSEAIVSIGGSVTTIVVHENGVPRFVRSLLTGGSDVTEAVAHELDVDFAQAEDLKRRAAGAAGDTMVLQATQVMTARIAPLVDEIRGSIDYYLANAERAQIDRVVVTGGGSRMAGLIERLEAELRADVVPGRPLERMKIEALGLSPEQVASAEALMAVPIGLAYADWPPLDGARRINLIPGDAAARNAQRRQVVFGAVSVAVVAGLLLFAWTGRQAQLAVKNNDVRKVERQIASTQTKVNALRDMATLESELTTRRTGVTTALAGDVAWTKLIRDFSATMPAETFISSFNGSRSGAAGTVSFAVTGVTGHPSAAAWMQTVALMPQLTGIWVPSVSVDPTTNRATFASSGELTPAAQSTRAADLFPPTEVQR